VLAMRLGQARVPRAAWEIFNVGVTSRAGGGLFPTTALIFPFHPPWSKTLQETDVLLLRHAETSAPDRFHGAESDIGLSDWGTKQAQLLAEYLKPKGATAVYSSALQRSIATAKPIGLACGLATTILKCLHERKIGPLSGISRDEGWEIYARSKQRWTAGDLDFTHDGGESFAQIRDRVVPIFEDLARRHQGETIIVVAHGVVIRVVLISLLEGYAPADFDRIAIDFASIHHLRWDGTYWKALTLNHVITPSPARPVA
jgi:probable phosphoglycerate mutase